MYNQAEQRTIPLSSSFACLFFILSFYLHILLSKVNTDYIRQAQIKNIDKTKKVVMKHSGRNHKITSLKYQFKKYKNYSGHLQT